MNGVTPSIYWAIRSLASFYSAQISLAQSDGLPSLLEIEEEEWPDEPSGEDSLDLSGLPDRLRFILLLDDLHLPGLHGISERRLQRGRPGRTPWPPMVQMWIETIPERELDDPPDSEGSSSDNEGLIVEFSGYNILEHKQNEDNKSS